MDSVSCCCCEDEEFNPVKLRWRRCLWEAVLDAEGVYGVTTFVPCTVHGDCTLYQKAMDQMLHTQKNFQRIFSDNYYSLEVMREEKKASMKYSWAEYEMCHISNTVLPGLAEHSMKTLKSVWHSLFALQMSLHRVSKKEPRNDTSEHVSVTRQKHVSLHTGANKGTVITAVAGKSRGGSGIWKGLEVCGTWHHVY